MNLVKIANMLKDASDQNLIQEMQNPSGTVPSYMVLSELDRRKKMRGSLMNNEPVASVAEDAEREAVSSGLGSMQPQVPPQQPVPMASGGTVHAARGWWQPAEDADYTGTDPTYTGEVQPGGLFRTNQMLKPAFSQEQDLQRRQLIASGVSPDNASRMVRGENPISTPSGKAVSNAVPVAPAAGPAANTAANVLAASAAAPGRGSGTPTAASDPYGLNSYLSELKGMRGDVDTAYQKQADMFAKQIEENKAAKAANAWEALIAGGLGAAAGRSQNAITNIAEGMNPALQQYIGAERARQKEAQQLAMGQGNLGIESLRARMEGAKTEAGLGLEGRKVGAEETKARAAMASAGAQSSYYKQAIAAAKTENDAAKIAASVINSQGFSMMDPADQKFFLGMAKTGLQNRFPGAASSAPNIAGTYNPKTGKIE